MDKSVKKDMMEGGMEIMSQAMKKARNYVIIVFTYFFYKFFRLMIVTSQTFTWAVSGVEKIRRDAKQGLQFKQSAHVMTIRKRRKFVAMDVADPAHFVLNHDSFKHPNYVLKPNVSLFCITKGAAVFVETPENINIHRADEGPMFITQFNHATKVISIPLPSFHKLASDVGEPRLPVAIFASTGKCGSGLLCEAFSNIPGLLVQREPDVLTNLAILHKNKILKDGEYLQLLASSICMLCKPDAQYGMIIIKPRPCCTALLEDIHKTFPHMYKMFMYRNSLKTVSSNLGLFAEEPILQAVRFIINNKIASTVLPFCRSILYHYFCHVLDKPTPPFKPSTLTSVGIFTLSWAANLARVADMREKGYPIFIFVYDDLMRNPRKSMLKLYDYLNIPQKYIEVSMRAFKAETGRVGSLKLKSATLFNVDTRKTIPADMKHEADTVLKKYGLPKLGEKYAVPGMIIFE